MVLFRLTDLLEAVVRATGLLAAAAVVLALVTAEVLRLRGHRTGRRLRLVLVPAGVLFVVASALLVQDVL